MNLPDRLQKAYEETSGNEWPELIEAKERIEQLETERGTLRGMYNVATQRNQQLEAAVRNIRAALNPEESK